MRRRNPTRVETTKEGRLKSIIWSGIVSHSDFLKERIVNIAEVMNSVKPPPAQRVRSCLCSRIQRKVIRTVRPGKTTTSVFLKKKEKEAFEAYFQAGIDR